MFGHSFGGAQALQFCHDDPRCKAGIDIDGATYGSVIQEGLKQPFMYLLSEHSRDLADPASKQILSDFQSIYNRLPNGRQFVTIRGANHFSFSDQMLVKSQYVIGVMHSLGISRLESRRGARPSPRTMCIRSLMFIPRKTLPPILSTSWLDAIPRFKSAYRSVPWARIRVRRAGDRLTALAARRQRTCAGQPPPGCPA